MKNIKGITLIALIITIIVMLILAGITISMLIGEDGIIKRAQNTAKVLEEKEMNEKFETSITYDNDGKIDIRKTEDNCKKNFGEENVKVNNYEEEEIIPEITIKGKYKEYVYSLDGNKVSNYINFGEIKLGAEVQFDSDLDGNKETWVIYNIHNKNIDIISKNSMGNGVFVGPYNKNKIPSNATDDEKKEVNQKNMQDAITDYNSKLEEINQACIDLIKAPNKGVKSVGYDDSYSSNMIDVNTDISWVNFNDIINNNIYDNYVSKKSIMKTQNGALTEYDKLQIYNLLGGEEFWIAIPFSAVGEKNTLIFDIATSKSSNNIGSTYFFRYNVVENGVQELAYDGSVSYKVKPVVTVENPNYVKNK